MLRRTKLEEGKYGVVLRGKERPLFGGERDQKRFLIS